MALDDILLFGTSPLHLAAYVLLAATIIGLALRLTKSTTKSSVKTVSSSTLEKNLWMLQFPPSRRHTLAEVKLKGSAGPYLAPTADVLYQRAIPSTKTANWNQDNLFTPTGFSTEDIRALGRFPDYSVLTGTRYPQPYGAHFDINKAIFRPFRPFRWNYHQTMGKFRKLHQRGLRC